ncbi:YdcF family protein [Pseudochryseolinea flava]|uniref:YdcF family protein n=1 Tax=Pseudochryseolinea flava TaxID=2059302 RepID=A0A364XUX3_9BACT|nr:YdcF family protein [Pseudochryseolinea flava]RAV98096.1 YdcF family protein [Pseudochryseolinea flava]
MFFVLSKTVSVLVLPLTIICILLLLSVFLKKPKLKRISFWLAVGLLLFFSNHFIANEMMAWWETEAVAFEDVKPHKLGIVLTGSTIPNRVPNDRVYFARGADRVTHTVQLYKKGLINTILISGGTGSLTNVDEPEADKFRSAMMMMGVDSAHIMIENRTRNTAESAIEVRKILDSLHYQPSDCLLITSAFHMRRSLACYRKAGLDLDTFSTDFYSHERNFYPSTFLFPSIDALVIWHKLVKEWVGLAAYWAAGYV